MTTKVEQGTTDGAFSSVVTGLTEDQLYYHVAWAIDTNGVIGEGAEESFTPTGAGGSAPANSVAPLVSGDTEKGSTLSTTDGTWSGEPTEYTYAWKRGVSVISGATSSTYTTVQADVGEDISCEVTAVNAYGSTAQDSSNSITVVDTEPPTLSSATIVGGGNVLRLRFSEPVENYATFALTASGGAAGLSNFAGTGTNTYTADISRPVEATETVTLAYTAGTVVDLNTNALANFSGTAVVFSSGGQSGLVSSVARSVARSVTSSIAG
jgi:hypothetical protein